MDFMCHSFSWPGAVPHIDPELLSVGIWLESLNFQDFQISRSVLQECVIYQEFTGEMARFCKTLVFPRIF
jgi:hypothetical protein